MENQRLTVAIGLLACALCAIACTDTRQPANEAQVATDSTAANGDAGSGQAEEDRDSATRADAAGTDAAPAAPAHPGPRYTCDREIDDHQNVGGAACDSRAPTECALEGSDPGSLAFALGELLNRCELLPPYSHVQVRLERGCATDLAISHLSPIGDRDCALARMAELRFACASAPMCVQISGPNTLP